MQPSSEIPEDVRAELDLEARRTGMTPIPRPAAERVPEDVRSELDRAQRVANEQVVGTLTEDGPPLTDAEVETES